MPLASESLRERPSAARYRVLAFSVSMAVLLYLDRMSISVAVPAIADDLDLQLSQVADTVAAFFWCYALMQVPAGWLGDRWGGRRALTLYVIAWSLAVAGMGLVGGFVSLLVMRALLGISQAGAYATTASFLRRWIPLARRGVANSSVSLGGRAGNVLAPMLTAALMRAVPWTGFAGHRWRPVFIAYALIGFVWAWFFWRFFRDAPALDPTCNAAERELIVGDGAEHVEPPVRGLPVLALVSHSGLIALAFVNFSVNVGWIFVGTLLPVYLIKAQGLSEIEAGFCAMLTAAAGMAGCLCGGLATDRCVARFGLVWGRRLPGITGGTAAALVYLACGQVTDVRAIVALLAAGSFLGDFAVVVSWATCQDIGKSLAGTVFGCANMCGNIGAAVAISLIGRMADGQAWDAVFAQSSRAYLLAAIAWLFIDPRQQIGAKRNRADDPTTPREA